MVVKFNPVSGTLDDAGQSKQGQVVINNASQLSGTLASDKVYFIDGAIDMGSQSIEVPAGGLTLEGHGYDISKLYSSENNYTMFTTPSGGYAGNLTINRNVLYVTGTSSKIFDVDNDGNNGALELNTVNLGEPFAGITTTSLGEITAYRQIRTSNFAASKYSDGLTISGTVSGIAFNDSILLDVIAGTTFLNEGTSLSITDGMTSNMNALSIGASSAWCDFTPSNFAADAVLTLSNFRTNATDAIPNIPSTDIKALYRGCVGVGNTFIGGAWVLTTEAATSITANKTLFKLAGTTTAELDAHFTHPANNRLQYNGERSVRVDVSGYIELSSSGAESFEITARQWDASAEAWVWLRTVPIETALKILGDRRGNGAVFAVADMDTGDYIEIWVQDASASGTANPTCELQSTISVRERQA